MYPYLTWGIFLLLVWLILYISRKDLRQEMLYSSLLFMPFGLTEPFFVPEYWTPVVVFNFWGTADFESLLWCFTTGGIAAMLYEDVFKVHTTMRQKPFEAKIKPHPYVIYSLLILVILTMSYIHHFTDLAVMSVVLGMMPFTLAYMYFVRPDLIRPSLIGAGMFLVLYFGSLYLIDFLFSNFIATQWVHNHAFGIKIGQLPIEEYLYTGFFGLHWSIVYEEIKGIRYRPEKKFLFLRY